MPLCLLAVTVPSHLMRARKDDVHVLVNSAVSQAFSARGVGLGLPRCRAHIWTRSLLPSWWGWSSSQRRCSPSVFSAHFPLGKDQQVQEPLLPSPCGLCLEHFTPQVSAPLHQEDRGRQADTRAKSTPLPPSRWTNGRSLGRCCVPL